MSRTSAAAVVAGIALAAPIFAAPAKPAAKPAPKPAAKPAENTVKGQGQLAGANGQFGAVYSIKGDFNVSIVGAGYSLDPFVAYVPLQAGTDTKLFVVDLALKNVSQQDNFFDADRFITLVDAGGQLYEEGSLALKSQGLKQSALTLRPGQGRGQVDTNDPLQMAFVIPDKARIVKIMINRGRLGKNEEVVRYYVAGATKAEAGEAGDPKNVARPLPAAVRDASDPAGNTPVAIGKTKVGEFVTTGAFALRLDSLAYTEMPVIADQELEEGTRYAVATYTAKALTPRETAFVDFTGGDAPLFILTDQDGETKNSSAVLQSKKGEPIDYTFKDTGATYTFRVVYLLKKDQSAKTLQFGAMDGRRHEVDVSAIK